VTMTDAEMTPKGRGDDRVDNDRLQKETDGRGRVSQAKGRRANLGPSVGYVCWMEMVS